jgi:hypothetical protein
MLRSFLGGHPHLDMANKGGGEKPRCNCWLRIHGQESVPHGEQHKLILEHQLVIFVSLLLQYDRKYHTDRLHSSESARKSEKY